MIFLISAEATQHFTDILEPIAVTNIMAKINMKENGLNTYVPQNTVHLEKQRQNLDLRALKVHQMLLTALLSMVSTVLFLMSSKPPTAGRHCPKNQSLFRSILQMPTGQSSFGISVSQCV